MIQQARSKDTGWILAFIRSFTESLIYSAFLPTNIYGALPLDRALGGAIISKTDVVPAFLWVRAVVLKWGQCCPQGTAGGVWKHFWLS